MRLAVPVLAASLGLGLLPVAASAQMVQTQAELKHYDVTIRRFDPAQGPNNGQLFVLPVDSPDAEHAIASTIANASAFSRKTNAGQPMPVAFMAVRIDQRR